jgi:hypothetical protein
MRRWMIWIVAGCLAVAGMFLAGHWIATRGQAATGNVAKGQPATPGTIVSQERLADANLDDAARTGLNEKLAIAQREAENRSAGEQQPASKDRPSSLPTAKDAPLGAEEGWGVFEGSEGLIKPDAAQVNNYWLGPSEDGTLMVAAGSAAGDSSHGVVVVQRSDGFSVSEFRVVEAPEGLAGLYIREVNGMVLTLVDENGTSVQFDLTRLVFVGAS